MQAGYGLSTFRSRGPVRTLADLAPGESAYAAPAALLIMPDRSCRIQTDAPIRRAPDAGATMHVTRTPTGYVADVTLCTHQWTPRALPDSPPHAPVVHLIFGDEFLQ